MVRGGVPAACGYSGTPLVRKIGVKPGHRLALVGAPAGWSVADLPDDVTVRRSVRARRVDIAIAFFRDAATMRGALPRLSKSITADGALWLAWPRRAGGHTSDITDDEVRAAALPLGLVDVKVAALDDDWSGLKLVWRKELRTALTT